MTNPTSISLTWGIPSDTGGNPITGYVITPVNATTGTQLPAINASASAVQYTITGLTTNNSYYFLIYAKNSIGTGAVATSNTIALGSGVVPPPPPPPPSYTLPGAPTNLTGFVGTGSVALSWLAPTTDGGSPITGYAVSYAAPASLAQTLSAGVVTNAIVSGLSDNVTYLTKVAAINLAGTGPYSDTHSFTTSSQGIIYPLSSWGTFNSLNQAYTNGNTVVPTQFNGLTAISRDPASTTDLYVTPDELYPTQEEVGKVTFRTVKRKVSPFTVNGAISYYNPPGTTVVSAALQSTTANLLQAGLIASTSPLPDAGYVQDILTYSARPGDVLTIYRKYQSYFSALSLFQIDKGKNADLEWKTNGYTPGIPVTGLMPGWSYEYTHTRPFLKFDTRDLIDANIITEAYLTFKKDPNCPIINPEGLTLNFVKANTTIGDTNLTTADYANIEGTVLATLPLLDGVLQSGQTVTLPLQDLSFITTAGFTKLIITTELENGTLPSDWTQITLQEVTLNLSIDTASVTSPGEVSFVVASAENSAVSLEWGAPVIDGGGSITAYTVTNMNTGAAQQVVAIAKVGVYSYTWTNLINGLAYTFKITASNLKGAGQGTLVSATPSATPTLPGPVRSFYALPVDSSAILSWYPPEEVGTSPIQGYYITNQTTGVVTNVPSTATSTTITGLENGTVYTISIIAKNATGAGPTTVTTVTPTDGLTPPSRPTITDLYATEGKATLYWNAPDSDGGDPLTGWLVTLDAPGIPNYKTSTFTVRDPNILNFTLTGVATGNTYIMSVAAVNSTGIGPYAISNPFTVSSNITNNGIYVPVNYNYQKFYEAPIELNIQSKNYLEYLYPESDDFYAEHSSAFIQSDPDLSYPVSVPTTSNLFYFTITSLAGSANYSVDLTTPITILPPGTDFVVYLGPQPVLNPPSIWTAAATATQINALCSARGLPIIASAINNRLSIATTEQGDDVVLSLTDTTQLPNSANQILFGNNPTITPGFTTYPVVSNVPTAEYDANHLKALVESRVWVTEPNQDISRPSIYFQNPFDTIHGNSYNINLVSNLRPNGVTIQYFDRTNTLVTLRDYLGDGRLLYRLKASNGPGEVVTFSYPADAIQTNLDPSDGVSGFGNINYETGEITNLIFPTFYTSTKVLYPTFKPSIVIGTNVIWPVYVMNDSSIYFDVNGVTLAFGIPKNNLFDIAGNPLPPSKTVYQAGDISALLNLDNTFRLAGLVAGVTNGQLYIQNVGINAPANMPINIGPTYTLKMTVDDSQYLTPSGDIKSINRLLFGMAPTENSPSKVYVTYSYTNNDPSSYRHIWYSTPHFRLRSAGGPTQFITKGHLDYLLDKLNLFRPAVSTLDNIEFVPTFTEITTIQDNINISAGTASIPYIQISPRPQVPTTLGGTSVSVTVINPDQQQDIQPDFYTYD